MQNTFKCQIIHLVLLQNLPQISTVPILFNCPQTKISFETQDNSLTVTPYKIKQQITCFQDTLAGTIHFLSKWGKQKQNQDVLSQSKTKIHQTNTKLSRSLFGDCHCGFRRLKYSHPTSFPASSMHLSLEIFLLREYNSSCRCFVTLESSNSWTLYCSTSFTLIDSCKGPTGVPLPPFAQQQ